MGFSYKPKLLVVQRVITPYRYQLLTELIPYYEITIVSSKGEKKGSLKKASIPDNSNIEVKILSALRISYTGESRSTSLFLFPQVILYILGRDILLLEGTTNLLNNLFIIPIAKLFNKKIIWWDAGYSLPMRSKKRRLIDLVVKPLIKSSHYQIAYSTNAKQYMETYMGAQNCKALINTLNTSYFIQNKSYIIERISNYKKTDGIIKMLYVGAIEKRKKILELIDLTKQLNSTTQNSYYLTIVGGGNYFDEVINYTENEKSIKLAGPIYDFEKLREYYFDADIFVMPGDGGLAIVQSILFGLPVICTVADGTENDYLNSNYIFKSLSEIKSYLMEFDYPSKTRLQEQWPLLYSSNWVRGFNEMLKQ